MKGYPIIFLDLTESCFLVLGHKTLLAGTVSFEGALLGHLAFRVIYLTFTHPGYLYSWESENMETVLLLPCVAAVTRAVWCKY